MVTYKNLCNIYFKKFQQKNKIYIKCLTDFPGVYSS